jgi:hypothetical protein
MAKKNPQNNLLFVFSVDVIVLHAYGLSSIHVHNLSFDEPYNDL